MYDGAELVGYNGLLGSVWLGSFILDEELIQVGFTSLCNSVNLAGYGCVF